jgi:hypothetical protein
MSAYGTKKRGGDEAVQLTFPQVFQSVYDHPMMYYPQASKAPMDIAVGHDFQANYHEQKRQEANRSVMNGIQARRSQERLLLTGPHNYHVPAAVLGQRRFANPSSGVVGFSSARQDGSVAAPFPLVQTLQGGVLRTAEGQGYIQKKRMERIEQLDRIDALASGQAVTSAAPTEREAETAPEKLAIEFNLLRQTLLDDLVVGVVNRFTYDNMKRMLEILFRLAPRADRTTLEDLLEGFDLMETQIRAIQAGQPEEAQFEINPAAESVSIDALAILITRARKYVVGMVGGQNLMPKERLALSKALVKDLKFNVLFKRSPRFALQDARRQGALDAREEQQYQDDDGDDDDAQLGRPAMAREDMEQGGRARQPLAGVGFDENQQDFGARAGRFLPGGEEQRPEMIEPFAAAEMEEVPAEAELDEASAYQQALNNILAEIGFREGMDADQLLVQAFGAADEEGRIPALEEELERRVEAIRAEFQRGQRRRPAAAEAAVAEEEMPAAAAAEEGLPQTRAEFDAIVADPGRRRALANRLGYRVREGTSLATIKATLLTKLREAGVDLVRQYGRRE